MLPRYRATIEPAWIDYNGHLRDAYYGLVLSYAIDDFMDHVGLGTAYREATHCTLYTLELHLHYLLEVKSTDLLEVETSVLDVDRKRIHAGCRFVRTRPGDPAAGDPEAGAPAAGAPVATGDVMLLHVHQGEVVTSAAFPDGIERTLQSLRLPPDAAATWGPVSRKIEIKRR